MNTSPFSYSTSQSQGAPLQVESALPFLRRVYTLFTAGIAFAIVGAIGALYVGTPAVVSIGDGATISVPPVVAFELEHGIVMVLVYFAAFFGASFARRVPGLNVAALFGYTLLTGLFIAPSIFIAQLMASQGATLDPSPVRDAFLLTGAAFTGLTAYVMITKKDFSYLGAALSMGLWIILGAMLLNFFFQAAALSLAIASVGVILFCGYILYDTSRILRMGGGDAIGAALTLFLDVINLFLMLLRILSSRRNS